MCICDRKAEICELCGLELRDRYAQKFQYGAWRFCSLAHRDTWLRSQHAHLAGLLAVLVTEFKMTKTSIPNGAESIWLEFRGTQFQVTEDDSLYSWLCEIMRQGANDAI